MTKTVNEHRDQDMLERLEKRLEDGQKLIESRRSAGLDVTNLETFWLELREQYRTLGGKKI